ncbi:helix-turn-helix domain-containing protein [Legionella quinlivanii]|nr:helix-turn-helix domain-containing protein [Legionella quinlivanii]
MDYLLLGWEKSTYQLKGSSNKWFMKPYEEIATDTGIPKGTFQRYLKEFSDKGFIERRQALFTRTANGEFQVKKGAYINITEKFLSILKQPGNESKNLSDESNSIHSKRRKSNPDITSDNKKASCSNKSIFEMIEPLNLRSLYISDLYSSSLKTNIIGRNLFSSVDKDKHQRTIKQFEAVQQFLLSDVKEEIPEPIKELISGTFFNLLVKNKVQISAPKQLAAEYLFALLNTQFYLPKVTCFKHRNNILSKLLRAKQWQTPKGFYNHFYLGGQFKDKQVLRETRWQEDKDTEINPRTNLSKEDNQEPRLAAVEAAICAKATLLDTLKQAIIQQSDEESILLMRKKIHDARQELEALWEQQRILELELEQQTMEDDSLLCA